MSASIRPDRAGRRARRGSNSVEFALLLPVYVALTFGVIDWGWMMYHLSALHSAAHKGCRAASLEDAGPDEVDLPAVIEVAKAEMEDHFDTHGPGCPAAGCVTNAQAVGSHPSRSIACRIQARVHPIAGLNVLPLDLSASAVVRFEYQRSAP